MSVLALQMICALGANAIGVLFLGSGVAKLRDQPGFASVIASYRLLPLDAAFMAARVLTGVQLVLGFWLCSGVFQREACLAAALLLAVFALAMEINVLRGRTGLSCGCLPGHDTPLSSGAVIRTLLLAAFMLGASSIGYPAGLVLGVMSLLGGFCLVLLSLAYLQLRSVGEAT